MSKRKILIAACCALLLAVLLGASALFLPGQTPAVSRKEGAAGLSSADDTETGSTAVESGGVTFERNRSLTTMLFLGIDAQEEGGVMGGAGFSDAVILLILDDTAKTTRILEIPRDILVQVEKCDVLGNLVGVERLQLAFQYSYGGGGQRSCFLTKKRVSEILYDQPIGSTLSLKMEGVAPLVDELGGISFTVPQDYTQIDPAFRAGEQLTLSGEQALRYGRWRDTGVSGSNSDRMERQMQLLRAVLAQYQSMGEEGIRLLLETADPYLVSDLDGETIAKLGEYRVEEEILKVPGQTAPRGEGHRYDEFDVWQVDESALKALVLKLFYRQTAG